MGINQHITIGVYIECDGTIGNDHWALQDSLNEHLYYIHNEGYWENRDNKDFWGINRYSENVENIRISNESMILEMKSDYIRNMIMDFKEEFKDDYAKLSSYYKERGIETHIKFGVISTFT